MINSSAWRAGDVLGRNGEDLPKRKTNDDGTWERCLDGYHYGRKMWALKLWCHKHGRMSVYGDPEPIPATDPPPLQRDEVERWLAKHRDLHLEQQKLQRRRNRGTARTRR